MVMKKFATMLTCFFTLILSFLFTFSYTEKHMQTSRAECAFNMPFYNLNPQELTLRAKFYTSFYGSSEERANNIGLATKSLNNVLIAPQEEFSFNKTVGARTEKRGYKQAKIIVGGKFIDGIGGGVCQVSSTLYNAVLLSGLKITEFHQHSLPVGYVAPSFDAMVNSGSADLRFLNTTKNPIIIKTKIKNSTIYVEIHGEPMLERYQRESKIIEEISPPKDEIIKDVDKQYPDLYEGMKKYMIYPKKGYKSEGYLIKSINGKLIWRKKIRTNTYNAMRGVVIEGTAIPPIEDENIMNLPNDTLSVS